MHFVSPRKRIFRSYLYSACILISALVAAHGQVAQGDKLVRVTDPSMIGDPVMITDISVAGKSVQCGLFVRPNAGLQPITPFQAGSDWIQQMTISLFNRTNKVIAFGGLNMRFLDTGDCHALPCASVAIRFGQRPAIDAYDERTGKSVRPERPGSAPLDWRPGQTFVVHVSDYMGDIEKSTLSNTMPVTAVTKVAIFRGTFYFDDGMRWTLGRFSVPDPEHPGKFNNLPAEYFPGARAHNLPPGYSNEK